MVDAQTAAAIKALGDRQVSFLTGTVIGTSVNPGTTQVRLDSDQSGNVNANPVTIPSICGILPGNARVSIAFVPPAGMLVVGTISSIDQFGESVVAQSLALRAGNHFWINPLAYSADDVWLNPIDRDPTFLGVTVQIQSAGGGSGGTSAVTAAEVSGSGGGQGGGYLEVFIRAAHLAETSVITVGAGGTAAPAGNNSGGNGGDSIFRCQGQLAVAAPLGSTTISTSIKFYPGNLITLSPGLPAQETATVTLVSSSNAGNIVTLSAPLANNHLILAEVRAASATILGGDGGSGGGAGAAGAAAFTSQNGGSLLQIVDISGGAIFIDYQQGGDGGTGWRYSNQWVIPGYGGAARCGGSVRVAGISGGQIIPSAGYAFGGGASGRGVYGPSSGGGGFLAGTGNVGAQGLVIVREVYRV